MVKHSNQLRTLMWPDTINITYCDYHKNCDEPLTFVCSVYPTDKDIGIIKSTAGNYHEVQWASGVVSFCARNALIVLSEI